LAAKNKGLGRGLDALIPSYESEKNDETATGVETVDIQRIRPNPEQPRKSFDGEKIAELSDSIRQHGMIQPIVAVKDGDNYMIVAGERRYRAAMQAGLKEVPIVIREFDPEQILQIALIENLQREDLNPLEEARAYRQLSEQHRMTQEQIAGIIGKSRAAIANTMRILSLPESVQALLEENKLSEGHARAILSLEKEKDRLSFAEYILKNSLSVREAEKACKSFHADSDKALKKKKEKEEKSAYLKQSEDELRMLYGTKINIVPKGSRGKIELEYYSNDDLERLITLLKGGAEE
jgi:ParB family chromosome partitioning protein